MLECRVECFSSADVAGVAAAAFCCLSAVQAAVAATAVWIVCQVPGGLSRRMASRVGPT
jgi:hypothetical protein